MDITFRIRRYNPESGGKAKPFWQEFELKDVAETNRVLEMLHRVKWEQDGTLSFRRSCSSGICGEKIKPISAAVSPTALHKPSSSLLVGADAS